MRVSIGSWAKIDKTSVSRDYVHSTKRSLRIADVVKKRAYVIDSFIEEGEHLYVPRSFFVNSNIYYDYNYDFDDISRVSESISRFMSDIGINLDIPKSMSLALRCSSYDDILFNETLIKGDISVNFILPDNDLFNYVNKAISDLYPDNNSVYLTLFGRIPEDNYPRCHDVSVWVGVDQISPAAFQEASKADSSVFKIAVSGPDFDERSGLNSIYKYHFGTFMELSTGRRLIPSVKRVWLDWSLDGKINPALVSVGYVFSRMESSDSYNKNISSQVCQAVKAGRSVGIVSRSTKHLNNIRRIIESDIGKIDSSYILPHSSYDDIAYAVEKNIVFIETGCEKTVPSNSKIDTIVLTYPSSDPLRDSKWALVECDGKKNPIVVDFRCDNIPVCKDYGKKRDDIYKNEWV